MRYEIGLTVQKGDICWVNGPFECGSNTDIVIFRKNLKARLGSGEYIIGDGGYGDIRCVQKNGLHGIQKRYHCMIRARHETVNKRLKEFNILRNTFRHCLKKHGVCFHAVANITQIVLERESPLFKIFL